VSDVPHTKQETTNDKIINESDKEQNLKTEIKEEEQKNKQLEIIRRRLNPKPVPVSTELD
jgi:hypothetical protein